MIPPPPKKNLRIPRARGFTLIELAIVLVVIGLVIAGVVSAQSIVRQAQVRGVIGDLQRFSMAYTQFYGQYGAIPGDFDNAYAYWGTTCAASSAYCNGNGNDQIEYTGADNSDREIMRAVQHLSLAALVPGTYSGTSDGTTFNTNDNSPIGKAPRTYLFYQYGPDWSWGKPNTLILMGNCTLGSWCGGLSAQDAKAIDTKLDDGIAHRGKLFAITGDGLSANACSAAKGTAGQGGDFNLASTTQRACLLVYQQMR